MSHLRCPHCQGEIELRVVPHGAAFDTPIQGTGPLSTSVRVDGAAAILAEDGYRPNPTKVYRTAESARRANLAHYYQHREEILAKARAARRQAKISGARRRKKWSTPNNSL